MRDDAENSGKAMPSGAEKATEITPRLRVSGVSKQYPGCLANDDVSFAVGAGEIVALLGENGAGKSTLVKIAYGLVAPDAGRIEIDGVPAALSSPAAARAAGIGVVFQHFSLFESLTVLENISIGLDDAAIRRGLSGRIREIGSRYGLEVNPDAVVADLSVGERQRVEIVRVLLQDPWILIFDEPTSVLTPQAIKGLFGTLRTLRDEGRAIVFISHKLDEILSLCDRATVLRAGRVVGNVRIDATDTGELARLMIGHDVPEVTDRAHRGTGEVRLAARALSLPPSNPHAPALEDVTLEAQGGEIFGIAGVAGNGQEDLLAALSGERRAPANAIEIDGVGVGCLGPGERRRAGFGFVPGERLGRGAVPPMSLWENGFLTAHWRVPLARRGILSGRRQAAFADELIARFKVATRSRATAAQSLSGGNLQRFIVGREIMSNPTALVVAYPTWGVDVAAVAAIHEALIKLRDAGAAIVMMSEELDELLALSDRIAVLYRGRLSTPLPIAECSKERLGLLMSGASGAEKGAENAA